MTPNKWEMFAARVAFSISYATLIYSLIVLWFGF